MTKDTQNDWLALIPPEQLGEILIGKPTKRAKSSAKPRNPKKMTGKTKATFKEMAPKVIAPPIREPRRVGPDQSCGLGDKKAAIMNATYRPEHLLGMSPFCTCHLLIDWSNQ